MPPFKKFLLNLVRTLSKKMFVYVVIDYCYSILLIYFLFKVHTKFNEDTRNKSGESSI